MESAAARRLTRKELRKKAVVLECYRDFWRRSQRPVCSLSEAEPYLVRAADIVVRIGWLARPEGDTGSPDGTKVKRAQSADDVEKAVLECVNHAACGGNSAEMLWDLEQCPTADPEGFVRELVHATLRDADKYVIPTLDETYVDQFIASYGKVHPFGSVIEDEDALAELEAVLASMQKTTEGLADVELPSDALKEIVKSLRDIDEKLAQFLPKPKKPEPDMAEDEEKQPKQEAEQDVSMVSESPSPAPSTSSMMFTNSSPATLTKVDQEDMPVDEPEKEKTKEQPKTEDATAMVDDAHQVVSDPITRQDSCLLKINTISDEMTSVKPKVDEIKGLVDALKEEELMKDPVKGLEQVEELQKQARMLSEQLMRALLSLDAINTNEKTRPLRKNQVIEVQQVMDEMDQVTAKLRTYSSTLLKDPVVIEKRKRESEESLASHKDPIAAIRKSEELKKEAEEKAKEEELKKEQKEEEEKKEESQEKDEDEDEEQEEDEDEAMLKETLPLWRSMKLRPRFDEQQQREAYVLTAMIPGLNRDEIVVNHGQDPDDGSEEIVVSGVRVPTLDEMKKLLRQIRQLQEAGRINITTQRGLQLALMQLGKGRYGSFEEHFSLPDDAIGDKVYATYNSGRLGIVIPRQPPQYREYIPRYGGSRYGDSFFDPFSGSRSRYGGFPGFF